MKTNTNTLVQEISQHVDDGGNTNYIAIGQLIDQYVHQKEVLARAQMKANVWQQFKTQMDMQSLSTPPTNGARFRTPLEELTIILEHEAPLAELQASLNTEGE